jgi:hypothetical protein
MTALATKIAAVIIVEVSIFAANVKLRIIWPLFKEYTRPSTIKICLYGYCAVAAATAGPTFFSHKPPKVDIPGKYFSVAKT